MENEKFADGFILKKPSEKAPEYIIANVSIKVADFLHWMNKNSKNGWTNMVIKESKGGKLYAELDNFEPRSRVDQNTATSTPPSEPTSEPEGCADCLKLGETCASCFIPF